MMLGRKKEKEGEEGEEEKGEGGYGEEYGHGKKRVLIIAVCVGITGTGSPNDVFAQYARVENSNQSSTGI